MIQRYGHVITRYEAQLSPTVWARITHDFQALLDAKPVASGSGDGRYKTRLLMLADDSGGRNTVPYVDGDLIAFNGEDGWGALAGDPMVLERVGSPGETTIIRTDHKPYDLFVCGLLLVIAVHAEETFEIASDGGRPEWDHALRWVREVLGYTLNPYWL